MDEETERFFSGCLFAIGIGALGVFIPILIVIFILR